MLVYAGIDEAGYGPILGPLCVGLSVFVLEERRPEQGPPDLWRRLRDAVCRSRRDRRHRVAIDDSKKLKTASAGKTHPLHHLERGVLGCLGALHELPADDRAYLALLDDAEPDEPWYQPTIPLPLSVEPGDLRISRSRLARTFEQTQTRLAELRCITIDAGPFNDQVARTGSKATVNFAAVLRLLDLVWARWPQDHPRVMIDRQGGRTHYREDLQQAFPDASIRILSETEALSRYRLLRSGSALTVSFVPSADSRHLPVALASMVAKYTRELYMVRLNQFFTGQLPELKPTAGYFTDGRRYLREIGPVIRELQLPRSRLVRQR